MTKIRVPEKDIQAAILHYLTLRGIFHYRQNSGSFIDKNKHFYKFASMDGLPDIVVVYGGRYIGIEVKGLDGRQRPSQIECERLLKESGGIYLLVKSLNEAIDEIDITITMIQKEKVDLEYSRLPKNKHGK